MWLINAGFRLTCRLPHCRFDDDICSTAQAPLAAEGWPSGKQRQANRSITLPLCPPRQIADSWIWFNSGAMPLGDKAKAALPLRAATLKQQAMITRRSGKAASGKLVWNQHKYVCQPSAPTERLGQHAWKVANTDMNSLYVCLCDVGKNLNILNLSPSRDVARAFLVGKLPTQRTKMKKKKHWGNNQRNNR